MGWEGVEGAQPRLGVCRLDDQRIPVAGDRSTFQQSPPGRRDVRSLGHKPVFPTYGHPVQVAVEMPPGLDGFHNTA
jgi:hypothetical protein